jgi:glycosylphosphatidylinositol transamidase (GPIT) subunit GPI8
VHLRFSYIALSPHRFERLGSHAEYRKDLLRRPFNDILVTDFFGSVMHVRQTEDIYPL